MVMALENKLIFTHYILAFLPLGEQELHVLAFRYWLRGANNNRLSVSVEK